MHADGGNFDGHTAIAATARGPDPEWPENPAAVGDGCGACTWAASRDADGGGPGNDEKDGPQ